MQNGEKKKIVVHDKHYDNLDQVPEEFRALVKERMDAAGAGNPAGGASRIAVQKDFQFQVGSGLAGLIKFLIEASQPPKPGAPKSTGFALPAREEARGGSPQPASAPIQPTSSGLVALGIIIGIAAVYLSYLNLK